MTDDLSRLRRLAGLLTENHDPATEKLLDQACDCAQPDCERCNPEAVVREYVEESVADAYAKFMTESAPEDAAHGQWFVRHSVRGFEEPEEKFDDEVSAKARARELLGHAAVSSVTVGPVEEMIEAGGQPEETWVTCDDCGGEGRVYRDNGPSGLTDVCDNCGGEGGWPRDEEIEEAADAEAGSVEEPCFTERNLRAAHREGWLRGRRTSPHYKGGYHRSFWDHSPLRAQLGLGPRGRK